MTAGEGVALAGAVVWAACLSWQDCRTRRLPNVWTVGGAAAALVFRLGYGGWPYAVDGFAAAAVAGAFLLVPFLLKGAGGGDVKMLFAAGAMVGWSRVFALLWATSLAGLVMGLALLALGHLDGARVAHLLRCACDWRYDREAGAARLPPKDAARARIPFSVPIAVGLVVAWVG
jgi:Flp pilus assembly protein protease CpaA